MILSRLFNVEKSKDGFMRIRIHPSVLDGGFPVLERIAAGTREVLMQYYVGCEKTYRNGVDVIAKAAKKPDLAEDVLEGVRARGTPAGAAPKRPGPGIKGILKKPVGPVPGPVPVPKPTDIDEVRRRAGMKPLTKEERMMFNLRTMDPANFEKKYPTEA
jgi:hypothetical protein